MSREKRKTKRENKARTLDEWDIQNVGGFDPEEYYPLVEIMGTDLPEMAVMNKQVRRAFSNIALRIQYSVDKILRKASRDHKVEIINDVLSDEWPNPVDLFNEKNAIDNRTIARLSDHVSIFYDEVLDINGAKVRIIPLMQLIVRADPVMHVVYGHPAYTDLSTHRKNEFIASLVCEKSRAVLFNLHPSENDVPTLAAIVENQETSKRIQKRVSRAYPNVPDDMSELLGKLKGMV